MTRNPPQVYNTQVLSLLDCGDKSEERLRKKTGMSGQMWRKVRSFLLRSRQIATVGRGAGKMYTLLRKDAE